MKTARQPQVGVLFDHELAWGEFMNTIHDDYRDLNVRGLEFYSYKRHQALITEFIDAPLLTTPEHPHMDPDSVQRYVELLLGTDEAGENWKPSIATSMSTTTFERLDHGWDGWIKKGRLIEDGIITKTELDLARQRMNSVHDIQPRMQHGDFVPWHIFDDDGTWIMYDAEHASPDFPRFMI